MSTSSSAAGATALIAVIVQALSQRARRYGQCGQSEASGPDFWASVNYGPAEEEELEPQKSENEEMEI